MADPKTETAGPCSSAPAGSEFCDGCCYLHPDEASQKRGENHVCQLYGYVLKHYGKHPRIPKPEDGCSGPYPLEDDEDNTPNAGIERPMKPQEGRSK